MSHEPTDPDERNTDREEADADEGRETPSNADEASPPNTDESLDSGALKAIAEDETLSGRTVEEPREDAAADEASQVSPSIPVDTLFELLATPGNRFVLTYLLREEDPATYSHLVEYVVTRARAPADLTEAKFRGRVAARLVHWNLPRLEDAGLIEHDADEHLVSATPAIEIAAPYLALAISQFSNGVE